MECSVTSLDVTDCDVAVEEMARSEGGKTHPDVGTTAANSCLRAFVDANFLF